MTAIDLQRADLLLLKFCCKFEKLYERNAITPNMHLHCHLKEIIVDHGPVHSFWCFSFERYNGIMGSISTNKRSLELQLMRKLILSRFLDSVQLPLQYRTEFETLLSSPSSSNATTSNSLLSAASAADSMSTTIPINTANWSDISHLKLPSHYKVQSLEVEDQNAIFAVYRSLYPEHAVDRQAMAETIKKYSSVTIGNQSYSSKLECRSLRSARIYASWAAVDQEDLNLNSLEFFAGYVLYYFSHSIKLNGAFVQHVFACVLWHKPDENPDRFGNPTKTWKLNDFLAHGPSRFLPVQRIYYRFAAAETLTEGEKKIVTVPLDTRQCSMYF